MDLKKEIEKLIDITINEDILSGDITTQACVSELSLASGRFILKQAGVLAGLPFLEVLFKKLDPTIEVNLLVEEGSYQKAGTIIAKVTGPAQAIITGERIALNLIQHASGIATITNAYVRKVIGYSCSILDTRKTMPGLRALEKYAVQVGGGKNHRFGLDERFIIKLNHLSYITPSSRHPVLQAIKNVKALKPNLPIEIEMENPRFLEDILSTDVTAIILINMPPNEIKECLKKIRKTNKKVYVESGGTITLDTIRAYAETGIDGISIGAITHSVQALDIGMRI